METFVFLGPSLDLNTAKQILPNANYLPPVACGDIISILPLKPSIIVIIDGYFENRPSVWHKEILYSINCGVKVYGASSMGALRASELDSYGMTGIGKIYDKYKNNIVCDDDEVALVHSYEMDGFKSYTIPMINIRFTIELALKEGIVSENLAQEFLSMAKNIFYQERTWENLTSHCQNLIGFKEFIPWLKSNYIDQKRLDAEEALKTVSIDQASTSNVTEVANTSLLRNLRLEKLSMPLSFFTSWLPIEFQLCTFAKLFAEEYSVTKSMAKTIGIAHNCGFIEIKDEQLYFVDNSYDEELYQQILNCFLKFITSQLSLIKENSFKIIARVLTMLYIKLKPYYKDIDTKILTATARNIYIKYNLDCKEKFYAWLQQKQLDIGDFNFALSIFYFFDYFILRGNLTTLFDSFSNENPNYFVIALSLNELDKLIIKTLLYNKENLITNNKKSLEVLGDNYAINQDFIDSVEMRSFINKISNLESSYLNIFSLKSWLLQ